jgi:hypothetical protein
VNWSWPETCQILARYAYPHHRELRGEAAKGFSPFAG